MSLKVARFQPKSMAWSDRNNQQGLNYKIYLNKIWKEGRRTKVSMEVESWRRKNYITQAFVENENLETP